MSEEKSAVAADICNITINKTLSWWQAVLGTCRHPSSRRAIPSICVCVCSDICFTPSYRAKNHKPEIWYTYYIKNPFFQKNVPTGCQSRKMMRYVDLAHIYSIGLLKTNVSECEFDVDIIYSYTQFSKNLENNNVFLIS